MSETPRKSVHHSYAEATGDGRLFAPTAERNAGPITEAMRGHVGKDGGRALEIASGTGQHVVAFARAYPHMTWQPTEIDAERIASVNAWRVAEGGENILPPIRLDATQAWDVAGFDFINLGNLFHLISPNAVEAIIRNVSGALLAGGRFFIYGPFRTGGAFRSESDAAFHARLVGEDAEAGYKDVEWVFDIAAREGLAQRDLIEMPANNLVVVFEKPGT